MISNKTTCAIYLLAGGVWGIGIALNRVYGLSFFIFLLILCGLLLALCLFLILMNLIKVRPIRRYNRAIKRIMAGETDAVITETKAKWDQGDHAFENAFILSAAYSHLGNGVEGEKFACETLEILHQRGFDQKRDRISRMFNDYGALAFYDAYEAQGRFIEAAHYLNQHLPNTVIPNYLTVVLATAFFLGHDDDNARAALSLVQPPGGQRKLDKWIPEKYLFMLAYLRHKLLGADMRPELNQLRDQYAEWQKDTERHAADPYGVRLQEILSDIEGLLSTDPITAK